jgi:membrane-associated protein
MIAAIINLAGNVGYPAIGLLVLAEAAGAPLPGETVLMTGAVLAGEHRLQIALVIPVAAAGAIAGDNLGYLIGQKGGRWLLQRPGPFARQRAHVLETGEPFFARHGSKAVFLGRWVLGLRTWASWLAGASAMPWRAFAFWNAAGAITWATGIGLAAYYLGRSTAGTAALFGIAGLIGLLAIPGLWIARRRHRRASRSLALAAPRPGPAQPSPTFCPLTRDERRCAMSTLQYISPARPSRKGSEAAAAIRVAVLDDHPAMRAGLEAILASAPDLRFVGAAVGEEDLWMLFEREQPRVLVLDLHHPGRDGLALCVEIKLTQAPPAIVLYTAAPHPEVGIAAMIAGADAILNKTSPAAALLDAIRFCVIPSTDPRPVSPQLTARAAARLDPSDHAIFAMRLNGTPPTEIADTLSLPVPAVSRQITQIAEQLATPARPAGHRGQTGIRPRPPALPRPPRRRRN